MGKLVWDASGARVFETGIDYGVLYIPNSDGDYDDGVAWNGLTKVNEAPTGAAPNVQWADNIKYLNLISAEEFAATLDAFTYPDEFAQFDGLVTPSPGVSIGQQIRKKFGLSYRSRIGNDVDGDGLGYKLHLVYGCTASPSQRDYSTVNASPAAINFSWAIATIPVEVPGYRPTSLITIDSTKVSPTDLAALELILYGDTLVDPRLPLPAEIIALFAGEVTEVTPGVPTYVNGTHTLTIPATTGVIYKNNGVVVASGAHVVAEDPHVVATPDAGYVFAAGVDDDWFFDYTP